MDERIPKNYLEKLLIGGTFIISGFGNTARFLYDEYKFNQRPGVVEYHDIESFLLNPNTQKNVSQEKWADLVERKNSLDNLEGTSKHIEDNHSSLNYALLGGLLLFGVMGSRMVGNRLPLLPQYLKERRERKQLSNTTK